MSNHVKKAPPSRRTERQSWENLVTDDVFTELANAIVKQAATDYMAAVKTLIIKDPMCDSYNKALEKKRESEAFFFSPWYAVLTTLDPEMLVMQLRAAVNMDLQKREQHIANQSKTT